MNSPPEVGGGQIWRQPEIPCFTRYIAFVGNGNMVLMSDPREQGSTAQHREGDNRWLWTPEELQVHLAKCGYECQGQLSDLLEKRYEFYWEHGRLDGTLRGSLRRRWRAFFCALPIPLKRWLRRRR